MAALSPLSKVNDLLDDIFVFISSKSELDHFTFKKFERDIQKLLELDAKKVLTGFLYIANNEIDKGLEFFEAAFEQYGGELFIVNNHLHALGVCGRNIARWEKSIMYANKLDSPTMLIEALDKASEYADLNTMDELLARIKPMEVGIEQFQFQIDESRKRLDYYNEIFSGLGINRDDVTSTIKLALQIMESNKVDYTGSKISNCDDDFLDIDFRLKATPEVLMGLNDKLIETWIEQEDIPRGVIPRFSLAEAE